MITEKQYRLLKFIQKHQAQSGVTPSYEDMRLALNLKSKSTIAHLISELEARGYCKRTPNKARTIEILKPVELNELPKIAVQGDNVTQVFEFDSSLSQLSSTDAYIFALPLYGQIAAGSGLEVFSEPSSVFQISASLIGPGNRAEDFFALRVFGDSMKEAGIFDGDVVILRKIDQVDEGFIVAALIDEQEITLKRIRFDPEYIILEPANRDYLPQYFEYDRVRIVGVLVNLIRNYN